MGRRTMLRSPLTGNDLDVFGVVDEIENLRQGTRNQYESPWTFIQGDAFAQVISFTHGLGEIPWAVDVLESKEADGKNATDGNSDVDVTKDDTTITVTNNAGADLYFKVRAL